MKTINNIWRKIKEFIASVGKKKFIIICSAALIVITAALALILGLSGKNSAHTHKYTVAEEKAASCTETGYIRYVCECGDTYTEKPGKTPHAYGDVKVTVAPSESSEGSAEKVCSVCGDRQVFSLPALSKANGYSYSVRTPPSCQAEGVGIYSAEIAGKAFDFSVSIPCTEHNYANLYCTMCGKSLPSTEGLQFELSSNGSCYAVTGYNGTARSVFVGDTYNDLPICEIGTYSFSGCAFYQLILGKNIDTLDFEPFYNCSPLEIICLSDSFMPYELEKYAKHIAFSFGESNITVDKNGFISYQDDENTFLLGTEKDEPILNLPENIGGRGYSVYGMAFAESRAIKITVPAAVKEISDNAFINCHALIEIVNESALDIRAGDASGNGGIGALAKKVVTGESESLISREGDYFYWKNASDGVYLLAKYAGTESEITLPDSIGDNKYSVADSAFYGNNAIVSLTVPSGVKAIGESAFENCTSLKSVVMQEGITVIGSSAFAGCTSLDTLHIADTVTDIAGYAFYSCSALSSVALPKSLGSIGTRAFCDCSSIGEIVIPASVVRINTRAFSDCTSLFSVKFENAGGWYVTEYPSGLPGFSGSRALTLTDSAQNAAYLVKTESANYFLRAN